LDGHQRSLAIATLSVAHVFQTFVLKKCDVTCIHWKQPVVAEKFAGIFLVFAKCIIVEGPKERFDSLSDTFWHFSEKWCEVN